MKYKATSTVRTLRRNHVKTGRRFIMKKKNNYDVMGVHDLFEVGKIYMEIVPNNKHLLTKDTLFLEDRRGYGLFVNKNEFVQTQ